MTGNEVLVHTVIGTAANVNDVTQAAGLLHGKEEHAWGDAGYQGVDKREELQCSKTCPGLMNSYTKIGGNHLGNERDEIKKKSL